MLHDLEARLMDPEVRRGDAASELIADDFMEFGGNGRIFNKTDALAVMKRHAPRVSAMEEFAVRELSPTIALATYRVRSQGTRGISRPASRFAARSGYGAMESGK